MTAHRDSYGSDRDARSAAGSLAAGPRRSASGLPSSIDRRSRRPRPWPRSPASAARTWCRAAPASRMERRPRAPVLRARAPCAAMACKAPGAHLEFDAFHREQLLVLLDQRVLRLGQDLDQRLLVSSSSVATTGRRPTNSGIRPNLIRSSGSTSRSTSPTSLRSLGLVHLGAEADAALLRAVADDLLQAVERAAADEQDVGGVDLDEFLVRVLAPALRRHRWRSCLRSA